MANAAVESALRGALRILEKDRGEVDRQIRGIRSLLGSERPSGRVRQVATGGRRDEAPKRVRMGAAARKAASARMKAYWKQWRAKKAAREQKAGATGRMARKQSQVKGIPAAQARG